MADLYTFEGARDPDTIRDDFLRVVRAGLIARGIANPNVTPDSDFYVEGTALGNELAVVEANAVLKADEQMPDTAIDEGLARICAIYGLAKRAAVGSTGAIIFESSAVSLIVTGSTLIDGAGLSYEVSVGGSYANGDSIPIAAVDLGDATNLAEGDSLRWVSAPTYSAPAALVDEGGLINGADAEDDEVLRSRLFARLQTPPGGGNWQFIAELAEAASPSVQKAFVYPAAQGPATVHAAVTASPTATNKSRVVASTTMSGVVVPYVQGLLPEHSLSTITTVADVNTDVAIGLSLPSARTASPPGPGGGWLDGTPWPSVDGTAYYKVAVTAVTSTTVFTVDARTLPTIGVSRIAWLSPYDWTLYKATVTAVSGSIGAYVITIDTPFVGIATGCLIFPQSLNQATYVAAILASYQLMGPGEKTTNVSALVRGFRHPTPSTAWPSTLGSHMLRAVSNTGEEVASEQFLYRTDGTTTINGGSNTVSPQVPGTITDPPKQFVPRHIAFYRLL